MKEVFKKIPGFENYQVSSIGRVRSIDRCAKDKFGNFSRFLKGKILKNVLNGRYYMVPLSKDGKVKLFRVHQLVAITFLDHKPNGYKLVVDHINNNPLDNKLENLQLITQRENCSKDKTNPGVHFCNTKKRYKALIRIGRKRKYLGSFHEEVDAIAAYKKELNEQNNT